MYGDYQTRRPLLPVEQSGFTARRQDLLKLAPWKASPQVKA
ncbi:hypothetical protein C8D88_11022 [Lentzea atacamensis]|uniref:Uncharacterized protein n=1 Tax=Lentzea atacamensis TaxID=531938 RepID=A0A316HQN9_9PSEU|nr:hypothetical protein [Lentzea atacamensis]PWK83566.1 hypothetical protein C8D88_11022 [Lentzea atacamensis]